MFLKWRLNRFIKSIDGSLFSFINQNMFKKSLFGALKKIHRAASICVGIFANLHGGSFIFFSFFFFFFEVLVSVTRSLQTLKVISDQ